ncbi:MAG: hypothetical protein Q9162_004363 [Coniocarpon cinnabarinum]
MKTAQIIATTGAIAGVAVAFPSLGNAVPDLKQRQDPNPWVARAPDGVRAPCPGMNTLANHGYINRNGMGISAQNVIDGFQAAFNMDPSVTTPGANNAINLCSSITGTTCQTFDLWMLDTTHAIEHDGSLTRSDRNETWNVNGNNYDSRIARNNIQMQDDTPGWFLQNDGGALTEHGFYLSTMNDQTVSPGQDINNPQARVDWIVHWWQQEELPTALGWVRPTQVISSDYVNGLGAAVSAAPTAPPAPGAITTEPGAIATADKRSIGLASVYAEPTGAARVANAASQASASAGPQPSVANAYQVEKSPEEWTQQIDEVSSYVSKFENALAGLLDLPPSDS